MLRITAASVLLLAMVIRLCEWRIVRRLLAKHARHPDQALALSGINPLERWVIRHLMRNGAVRNTANWRYYLVSGRYSEFQKRRRLHALAAVATVAFLTFGFWFLGVLE